MNSNSPFLVKSFEELQALFEYDQARPLNLEVVGSENKNGIIIQDINYDSLAGGKNKAYLVMPNAKGSFPGILFVHPGPGDRSSFLEDAVKLAEEKIVSLLVEAPWAQAEAWGKTMGEPEHDYQEFIKIAKDLRRALDLLNSLPEVDNGRIGYVGHSFGGIFGGLLAGLEKRVSTYVLMSAVGRFTDVAALNIPTLTGEALAQYGQVLQPIEAIYYIDKAAPATLFFQFDLEDKGFGREKFEEYVQATSNPKQVKWYQADHYSVNEVGRSDRIKWLLEQLQN